MTNSILIPKYIYEKLSQSEELQKLVDGKIFPLVAENTTTFPFITYFRTGITPTSLTKDGYCEDEVSFVINIVDTNYSKTLQIAQLVRKIMETFKHKGEEYSITRTRITEVREDYIENAFVQTLYFSCYVEN